MICDDAATKVSAAYRVFLYALMGRYQQLRAPGLEMSPSAIAELQRDSVAMGSSFYENAKALLTDYVSEVSVGSSEGLQAHISAQLDVALEKMRGMVVENVKQTMLTARTGIQNISSVMMGASGAIGQIVKIRMGAIDFKATDTSGRRWDAKRLMFVVVRDFAYQALIDVQIEALERDGVDLVETTKGDVFSLKNTEGFMPAQEARETLFHPNSRSTVAAHVHS